MDAGWGSENCFGSWSKKFECLTLKQIGLLSYHAGD